MKGNHPFFSILFFCCCYGLIVVRQVAADENITDNTVDKIVGGTAASSSEFPGYAIPSGSGILCGAYLIQENILVSAAHCAGAFAGYNVIIGATLRNGADAKETKFATQECVHPNFKKSTMENDIMLIKLQTPSNQPFKDYYTVSDHAAIKCSTNA
jgi:secreted trypsin-like serine protease